MNTLNKEIKHSCVIPFPRWITPFCPNIHLIPQGLLIKPGKQPKIIWGGSFIPEWRSTCINIMQDQSKSLPIHFGTALTRHLVHIWNTRITYPRNYILIWDDDVLGAYRIPKYNPTVGGAFAFSIMNYFCLPTRVTLGSVTSPVEYEPMAQAKAFFADHLSSNKWLLIKHQEILNLVGF